VTDESAGLEHRPTFLVTGATSGLGEAIATQLSERGARVLMGARTAERGQVAADRIRSRVPDADLQVAVADLSLMQEVRSLAYQIMDSTPRLDGLILNAAEARSELVLTDDGIETNFATNHLAGFLLTQTREYPTTGQAAAASGVRLDAYERPEFRRLGR
jgi:NAD(P)-dependent dehydrogenase (short-subunit alcohol dehydrogenase family)